MKHILQKSRGLVLVRTATLLLVATYTDNMHPSVCVEAVEKLGKRKKLSFKGTLSHNNSTTQKCVFKAFVDDTPKEGSWVIALLA